MIFGSESAKQRDLVTERYDNLLSNLPALNKPEEPVELPESRISTNKGDDYASLENELNYWTTLLRGNPYSDEFRHFYEGRIKKIKDEIIRQGYEPKWPWKPLTPDVLKRRSPQED